MGRISPSALSAAARVNGQMRCDCGCLEFSVGIAHNPDTGNNFIRILECITCGKQHLAVHKSDARIEPSIAGKLREALS